MTPRKVPAGAAWAGVLVGATMMAAPLAPGPTLVPAGVGEVPAAATVRSDGVPPVDLLGVVARPAPAPPPRPPVRMLLPALGVDAAVTPVSTDAGGGLAVPDDPAVVGWWRGGAAPGSAQGSVVLVGHVDTRGAGPGALFRAAALRPGDRVVLGTGTGDAGYAVVAVRHYPKAQLPAEVFADVGTPRLVLVTCGGAFDRRTGHYADNVVVYAVPAG